jgi:glutamyl-tRNA reductase
MEFNTWMNGRKHAPTIHALKAKLNDIVENELTYQRKKLPNFDEEQAELISARIIQKITNHFASHLKDENTSVDESIEFIEKVFQIGNQLPVKKTSEIEEKYKITLS